MYDWNTDLSAEVVNLLSWLGSYNQQLDLNPC